MPDVPRERTTTSAVDAAGAVDAPFQSSEEASLVAGIASKPLQSVLLDRSTWNLVNSQRTNKTIDDANGTHRIGTMDDMMDFPDDLPERPRTVIEEVYERFYMPDCSGQPKEDMYAYCHPNGLVVIGITRLHPLSSPGLWDRDAGGQQAVSSGEGDAAPSMEVAAAAAAAAPSAAAAAEIDGNGANGGDVGAEPTEDKANDVEAAKADVPVVDFSTKKSDYSAKKISGKKANKGGSMLQAETVICKVTPPGGEGRCFKLRALARSFLLEVNERLQEEPDLLHRSPQQEGFLAILKLQNNEVDRFKASTSWLSPAEYAKLRGIPEASLCS